MMGRRKKQYDDDDGRTIADMSQVSATPSFISQRPDKNPAVNAHNRDGDIPEDGIQKESRSWEDTSVPLKERLMWVMGAMKATLLIGFAYLAGFAILIWLLLRLWK